MANIYFIDSENVGDEWIKLIQKSENDSLFNVFYTSKSPRLTYEDTIFLIDSTIKPNFILCNEGNNALDFQLVSYLGYCISKNDAQNYIIVSKDTGYDAVVKFWNDKGFNVSRISNSQKNNSMSHSIDTSNETLESSVTNISIDTSNNVKTICNIDIQEIENIMSCIPDVTPKQTLHMILVHLYGSKKGLEIYRFATSSQFKPSIVSYDKNTRFTMLCNYIIKYTPDICNMNIEKFEQIEVIELLRNNFKEPAKFYKLLIEKYGNTTGHAIYVAFKPYFSIFKVL